MTDTDTVEYTKMPDHDNNTRIGINNEVGKDSTQNQVSVMIKNDSDSAPVTEAVTEPVIVSINYNIMKLIEKIVVIIVKHNENIEKLQQEINNEQVFHDSVIFRILKLLLYLILNVTLTLLFNYAYYNDNDFNEIYSFNKLNFVI